MEKIHVGFELAEIDLKMRGSGEVFGTAQSGFASFKISDIADVKMLVTAQQEAKNLILEDEDLKKHPQIATKIAKFETEFVQPN